MVDTFNCQLLHFTVKSNFLLVVFSFSDLPYLWIFFSRSPFFYATFDLRDKFSTQLTKCSSSHFLQFKVIVNGLINGASNLSVNVALPIISKTSWNNDTKIMNMFNFSSAKN